jgi:4'-phosphopantetheinyl transferase
LNLADNEIHVWLAFDREFSDEPVLQAFETLLSPDEQARRGRLKAPGLSHQFLVTRALQRSVLSSYSAGVAPEAWRFEIAEHGKPSLAPDFAGAGLNFNIAHSAGLVVMAISRTHAVGVDVEHVGARRVPFNVAQRYFSAEEARELEQLDESERRMRFFALWTLKEAWLKATGQGVAGGLGRVRFTFESVIDASGAAVDGDDPLSWRFWQSMPSPDYLLALALRSEQQEVEVRLFRREPGVEFRGTRIADPRPVPRQSDEEQRSQT